MSFHEWVSTLLYLAGPSLEGSGVIRLQGAPVKRKATLEVL